MEMPDLLESVCLEAEASLEKCCGPCGVNASGARFGHHQIWARDSMIALLGGRFSGREKIQSALRASIGTLQSKQSSTGCIPNNVDPDTGRPNFRAYADGGLWWIVGSCLVSPDLPTTRHILEWYAAQDVDQSGLISMQESTDWQDLFCTRGKGLYLNCLYVLALRAASRLDGAPDEWAVRAEAVARKVNDYLWYQGDGDMLRHISHTFSTETAAERDSLGRRRWLPQKQKLVDEQYYVPYLGFRAVGEWFDSLGNLLAILSGVADGRKAAIILDFISRCGMSERPLAALTPVVEPGQPDWRDYYGMLNEPHSYHNGGVWPFIGGFYVAALVHVGRVEEARGALRRLALLNREGGFNEWHHGLSGAPMGVRDQAWSAGAYLFAHQCVLQGKVLLP